MIDIIYKKIVRFLIKYHIAIIDFGSENEVDEFYDWLYSDKSQKRELSMKKKVIKICAWTIGVVGVVCLALMLICNQIVVNNAEGKVFSDIDSIKYNKVGLLLGTTPQARIGRITNYFFIYRIDAAEQLYKSGKIEKILISGDDHSLDGVNETECMRDSLVARGIPASSIILDGKGYRTICSVINANKVYGLKSFTIISQQFHNERAIYQAEHLGLDVKNLQAYNAKMPTSRRAFLTTIREYFARVKMFLDLWTYKPSKRNQPFKSIPDPRVALIKQELNEGKVPTLFGVSMKGTNQNSIVRNLIEQTEEFEYFDKEKDDIKRVNFCGVPCGLNIHAVTKGGMTYITRITLLTSLQSKKAFEAMRNGIAKRCGEPEIEEYDFGTDEIDGLFYGKCKWLKEGAILRNVNGDEDGLFCFLEVHNSSVNKNKEEQ